MFFMEIHGDVWRKTWKNNYEVEEVDLWVVMVM